MSLPPRAPAATVLVAAPASGQGKTSVACALARLHSRAGARVRAFKCGPDFLDPAWLALASGGPVDALDLWITGEADCARRLQAAAQEADLVIVEGVMGLYDGQPSAADLARRFGLPVLAVIDARAMAGTFGALVHGLRHYRSRPQDGALPWAGVLANRVGSERHAQMLADSLQPDDHWLGAMPPLPAGELPDRHLGLVASDELPDALARLDALADALATTPAGQRTLADWPRWQGLQGLEGAAAPEADAVGPARGVSAAGAAADGEGLPLASLPPLLAGRTVAVARDAAFAFVYEANLATLRALGAQVVCFAPLAGDALPACDAVWLPGGYPELHAAALSARTDLREQLHAHVAAGRPVWAECGGLMALCETLVDQQGHAHALWGLLPGTVRMGKRLAALGPQGLGFGAGGADGGAADAGGADQAELRGHTFHHSTLETPLTPAAHTRPPLRGSAGGLRPQGEALYEHGAVRASYFHPWFASAPALAARLFLPQPLFTPTGAAHA